MAEPHIQPKKVMDPPEERRPPCYALGDVGKLKDMADGDNNLSALSRLKPMDPCFVLRSGGRFTFAKVISRQDGPEAQIELQVDYDGSTKTLPMIQCAKYVRTLNSMVRWKLPSAGPNRRSSEPPRSENFDAKVRKSGLNRRSSLHSVFPSPLNSDGHTNNNNNGQQRIPPCNNQSSLHSSCQLNNAMRSGFKRHSSVRADFFQSASNPDDHANGQRRPSRKNMPSLHSSCQSGLGFAKSGRPGLERHSSIRTVFSSTPNPSDHNDDGKGQRSPSPEKQSSSPHSSIPSRLNDVKTGHASINASSLKMPFKRSASNRSSIVTHVPEDTSISESVDEIMLSSSDSEIGLLTDDGDDDSQRNAETTTNSKSDNEQNNNDLEDSSSSSDEESRLVVTKPLAKPNSNKCATMKRVALPMKRVPLPGGFDDMEYNEEFLIAAFRCLG